jgi:4-amino-4-deoxy-L-arabinose transferase
MKKYILLIIVLFSVLYIAPLSLRPLVVPDETRYAQISREMINSSNWVVPHLNGLRYFEKPVMGYWINNVFMTIFGQNNFGARFGSAFAALLTTLIIFFFARTHYENRKAFIISIIYMLSTEVFIIGNTAILDGIFNLFTTASFIFIYFTLKAKSLKKVYLYIFLLGIALGAAFMTKGFLVFAITGISTVAYCLWEFFLGEFSRFKELKKSKIIIHSILIFLVLCIPIALIVIPWALAINKSEPDFWRYFIYEEHIRRFLAKNAQHSKPFYYYFPILFVVFMPWTLMLPLCISKFKMIKNKLSSTPFMRFTICWFALPLLFFSISKGKLPTYILPCIAPLAILFYFSIEQFITEPSRIAEIIFNWVMRILIFIIIVAMGAFAFIQFRGLYLPDGSKFFIFDNSFEKGKVYALFITALMLILFFYKILKLKNIDQKILIMAMATAAIYINLMSSIPYILVKNNPKTPEYVIKQYSKQINPLTILCSGKNMVTAVAWFTNRKDIYTIIEPGELAYGIKYNEETKSRLLKDTESFNKLLEKSKGRRIIMFMKKKRYIKDILKRNKLPKPKRTSIKGKIAVLFYEP